MGIDKTQYVVLDVETNGTSSKKDDLLSVCIYKPDSGEAYERYLPLELNDYIKTGNINGIDKACLRNKKPITQEEFNYLLEYFELRKREILIFGSLDEKFLRAYMKRHNLVGFHLLHFRDIKKDIISPVYKNFSVTKDALCRAMKIGPVAAVHSGMRDCFLEWCLFEKMNGRRLVIKNSGAMYFLGDDYLMPASWTYTKSHSLKVDDPLRFLESNSVEMFRCEGAVTRRPMLASVFGELFERRVAIQLDAKKLNSEGALLLNDEKLVYAGRICSPFASGIDSDPSYYVLQEDGTIELESGSPADPFSLMRVKHDNGLAADIISGIADVIEYLRKDVFLSRPILYQELIADDERMLLSLCDLSNECAVVEIKTGEKFNIEDVNYQLFAESDGRPTYILWFDRKDVVLSRVVFSFSDGSAKRTDCDLVKSISEWRRGLVGSPRGAMKRCSEETGIDYQKVRSLWGEAVSDESVFDARDESVPIGVLNEFAESTTYAEMRTERQKELLMKGFAIREKTLVSYMGYDEVVSIPLEVRAISPFAFSGNGWLKKVVIPEGITDIPEGAFKDCWELSAVIIPSSVEMIGESAFNGCYSLETVEFASGSKLKEICGCVYPPGSFWGRGDCSCFGHCVSLRSPLAIPDSIERFKPDTFHHCGELMLLYCDNLYTASGLSRALVEIEYEKRRKAEEERQKAWNESLEKGLLLAERAASLSVSTQVSRFSLKDSLLGEMDVDERLVLANCRAVLEKAQDSYPDRYSLVSEDGKKVFGISRGRNAELYDFLRANVNRTFAKATVETYEDEKYYWVSIAIEKTRE